MAIEDLELEEGEEPIVFELWDEARANERRKQMEEEIKDIEKDAAEQFQSLRDALVMLDEKVEKRMLLPEDDYRKLEALLDVLGDAARPRHERSCPFGPGRCGCQRTAARN